MDTLKERLMNRLWKARKEKSTLANPMCRKCIDELMTFVQRQENLGMFDDYEFNDRCESSTGKSGQKWHWGEILLLSEGQEKADLVFKMVGRKFEAEIVDLELFENNYGLF
jgi:hypothetical protein